MIDTPVRCSTYNHAGCDLSCSQGHQSHSLWYEWSLGQRGPCTEAIFSLFYNMIKHFSTKIAREKHHLQPRDWSYFEFIFTISSRPPNTTFNLKSFNFSVSSNCFLYSFNPNLCHTSLTSLLDDKLDSSFTEKKRSQEKVHQHVLPTCLSICQLLHLCNIAFLSCNSTIFAFAFCCCCCYAFSWVIIIVFLWPHQWMHDI